MKRFLLIFFMLFYITGCDLQPKLVSVSNDIEDFIDTRYPALLADPEKQPEIYESAISDYGIYQTTEIYGSELSNDYVLYASPDDYIFVEEFNKPITSDDIMDEKNEIITEDIVKQTEFVTIPVYQYHPDSNIAEITVQRGETLHSISRKYNVKVQKLIELNNLKHPYSLKAGQKLMIRKNQFVNGIYEKNLDVKLDDDLPNSKKNKIDEDVKYIIVEKGETLHSISRKYNIKVQKLIELNNLKHPYSLKAGQKLLIKSEHVTAIAKNISKTDVEINKTEIKTPTVKKMIKKIPLREIEILSGETLYSISRKYKIPVNDLAVLNNLKSPFILNAGQKLKIPNVKNKEINKMEKIVGNTQNKKQVLKTSSGQTNKKQSVKNATNKVGTKNVDNKISKSGTNYISRHKNPRINLTTSKIMQRSSSKFSWPVHGKIVSYFGSKSNGLFNDGINISAQFDTPILSAENGRVAYAGNEVRGMGNLVMIQHADGWITVYAHLNSITVKKGDIVKVNQKIGNLGATGKVTNPELHFEIRKGKKAYNPSKYLK